MHEVIDKPEFSDDELRAALKRMGTEVRRATKAAHRPIIVFKNGTIVAIDAKGKETIIEPLPSTHASQ